MKKMISIALSLLFIAALAAGCSQPGKTDPSLDPSASQMPEITDVTGVYSPTPMPTPSLKELVEASEPAYGSVIRAMSELGTLYDIENVEFVWTVIYYASSYMYLNKSMLSAFPGENITITQAQAQELYGLLFKNSTDLAPLPENFGKITFDNDAQTYTMNFETNIGTDEAIEIGDISVNDNVYTFNAKLSDANGALKSNYIVTLVGNDIKTTSWCPMVVAMVEPAK